MYVYLFVLLCQLVFTFINKYLTWVNEYLGQKYDNVIHF